MTKKEIEKKFKFSGKDGECSGCEYGDHCDKILPGFNKPGKCGGPFKKESKGEENQDKKEKKKKNTIKINESDLRKMIAESVKGVIMEMNEGGGYDMSTPEGRQGAENWMRYIMSQEDPAESAAREWAQENGLDGDENIIRAFTAGVEYGRELN